MSARAVGRPVEQASPRMRTLWVLGDQLLSSLGNFLLGVVVARAVGAEAYGAFGVGFVLYGLGLGVARALGTDPLVVRFSHQRAEAQHDHARAALGTAVLVGCSLAVPLLIAAATLFGTYGGVVAAFAVSLPVLFLQDAYRYVCFANRRPTLAVANDGLWVSGQVLLFAAIIGTGGGSAPLLVAAWGLSSAVGAGASAVRLQCWPRLPAAVTWLRAHGDLSTRFVAEFLVVNGGTQVVLFSVAAIAGLASVGALRGAYVVMGPILVLVNGLAVAAVPEGSRLQRRSPVRFRRSVTVLASVVAGAVLCWSAAFAAFGSRVGPALLGETWPMAQPLLPALGVAVSGAAAWAILAAGLRSLGAAGASMHASLVSTALVIAGGVIGTLVAGASGAVVGMVLPSWVGVGIFANRFRREMVSRGAAPSAQVAAPPVSPVPARTGDGSRPIVTSVQ